MLKFGTIFILASITNPFKNSFVLILKLHVLKQLINNFKMNFYGQKHQNRTDFACIWHGLIL
jgi:hypothetical protein